MRNEEKLEVIKRYQKEIILLERTIAILSWDEETNMPKEGVKDRSEKISFLTGLMHERLTSEDLFIAIESLSTESILEEDIMAIDKFKREIEMARKIPKEFVEKLSKTTTLAHAKWIEAREKRDFNLYKETLKEIIELKREEARLLGFKEHPYDSLVDRHEEGMTWKKLKEVFDPLKISLIELLKKIEESDKYRKHKRIHLIKEFNKEKQMEIVRDVVKRIGLSEDRSRIDFAEHPFMTSFGRKDVRITTGIRNDPLFAFLSSIHEAGHALYELEMPEEHNYNFLCREPSTGIHESQSKFWENMIAIGSPFWRFYFNLFNETFELNANFEELYLEVNEVRESRIRIESDEVHYCLHIILRAEIEAGLIDGSIKIENLRDTWNKKTEEYFGFTPRDDKEGILQDVHWAHGYIGYFPTYAIGCIYAAQLYKKMTEEIKGIERDISEGKFDRVGEWLKNKIHKHGKRFLAEDLIKNATGEGLNPKVFTDYLNKKYSEIYELGNR